MCKMYKNYFQNFVSKFIQQIYFKCDNFQRRVICFLESLVLSARTYVFFPMVLLISNSNFLYQWAKSIESTSLVLWLEIFSFSIFAASSLRIELIRKLNGCVANWASQNAIFLKNAYYFNNFNTFPIPEKNRGGAEVVCGKINFLK